MKGVKEARCFSLMMDDVECHHAEQLLICWRFVDKECNIRERFFEFRNFEQKNGEFVFREIMRIIEKHFNIEICHGQAYDGAVNMSSQNVGVQKQLKDFCKKFAYTHCYNHNLSLVVV